MAKKDEKSKKNAPLIGIDIGGTGIKGGIVDLKKGKLIGDRLRIPTPQPSTPESVAEVVAQVVAELSARPDAPAPDSPVGVTFPGIIQHGVVHSAANVDKSWLEMDIDGLLTARLGRPVEVINDADAAGLAEARFGAGEFVEGTVLVITLGTGIGSAFIFDGKLVPNAELGHLEIDGFDAESQGLGRGPRAGRPELGRVQRAAAALPLPRGIPLLPRTVHHRRRHLQARRRIPAAAAAAHADCPGGTEERRRHRRRRRLRSR